MTREPASYPITITVPALFYSDHRNRDCGNSGVIVSRNKVTVTVSLDQSAWLDLLSDADYYASFKGCADYQENRSLVDSAIRTLNRLHQESKEE